MKKFVSTFPYLLQLEGLVTPERRNRCTRWVCPCSTKVYNKSLWKWFPCNLQEEFMLNVDNPPCSNRKGHLYGTDNELIKHCKAEKTLDTNSLGYI